MKLYIYLHSNLIANINNIIKLYNMEEKENLIGKYYASLTRQEKTKFQLEVCRVCDISLQQFNRRKLQNSWSKLEREAIMRLIS